MKQSDNLFDRIMSRRRLLMMLGMGFAIAALDACGSQTPYYGVSITESGTFDPSPLVIAKGEKVIWINKSIQPFTITCDPNQVRDKAHVSLPDKAQAWASPILYTGQTWAYIFNTPGSYIYTSQFGNAETSTGQIMVTA